MTVRKFQENYELIALALHQHALSLSQHRPYLAKKEEKKITRRFFLQ